MRTIIALLMLGSAALADERWGSTSGVVTFNTTTPYSLIINMGGINGKPMVTIRNDGTIEYGPDYHPDAAAKMLWDAVGVERKARNCQ